MDHLMNGFHLHKKVSLFFSLTIEAIVTISFVKAEKKKEKIKRQLSSVKNEFVQHYFGKYLQNAYSEPLCAWVNGMNKKDVIPPLHLV